MQLQNERLNEVVLAHGYIYSRCAYPAEGVRKVLVRHLLPPPRN
ncbi:hypothetical protein TSAR_006111 [Trichomalopsis sarcophagae]|uniref:Uncharacterized protein n=1 Tax=Trichomalopsis sarcophagae TaxID=543379 RepID=A0A232F153_9HYME|nr:hypothetical protein TSAR_006111 [Trichomalopsis sarcophagae]